jgi:hypothetical protein
LSENGSGEILQLLQSNRTKYCTHLASSFEDDMLPFFQRSLSDLYAKPRMNEYCTAGNHPPCSTFSSQVMSHVHCLELMYLVAQSLVVPLSCSGRLPRAWHAPCPLSPRPISCAVLAFPLLLGSSSSPTLSFLVTIPGPACTFLHLPLPQAPVLGVMLSCHVVRPRQSRDI